MRYTLLIYTNEADRPQWGTPEGDAEAKGYNDFHGEVTQRGVLRGGEPLLRVADATSVRVRNGDAQIRPWPSFRPGTVGDGMRQAPLVTLVITQMPQGLPLNGWVTEMVATTPSPGLVTVKAEASTRWMTGSATPRTWSAYMATSWSGPHRHGWCPFSTASWSF
jgi:hypothetical protein